MDITFIVDVCSVGKWIHAHYADIISSLQLFLFANNAINVMVYGFAWFVVWDFVVEIVTTFLLKIHTFISITKMLGIVFQCSFRLNLYSMLVYLLFYIKCSIVIWSKKELVEILKEWLNNRWRKMIWKRINWVTRSQCTRIKLLKKCRNSEAISKVTWTNK